MAQQSKLERALSLLIGVAIIAASGCNRTETVSDVGQTFSELSGTTTPSPTANWSSSGTGTQDLSTDSGYWADAQISASDSRVVVTQRASIGVFTRQGTQLQHVSGQTFFSGLLPSGSPGVFDLRTVYDRFRQRFWIAGLANSAPVGNGVILIAVSKTKDPADGWYKYNWNGQVPGATRGVDYPCIAISSDAFMVANDGGAGVIWRFFPADQMAAGDSMLTGFWAYWGLTNNDGSSIGILQPAMVHDGTGANRHYAVTRYGARGLTVFAVTNPLTTSRMLTQTDVQLPNDFNNAFAVGAPNGAPQSGTSFKVGMYLWDGMTRTQPLKSVARNGKLYAVMPDAMNCGQGGLFSAIRVVRLDVTGYPTIPTSGSAFVNRTFGCASPDDPPNTYFHYGWPAIEVNRFDDMAIVYMRTGSTIMPQIRYSAYGATDSDIRPSALLFSSPTSYNSSACGGWCSLGGMGQADTAGASIDPTDDTGIWIAQMVPDANTSQNFSIRVGKVYGQAICGHDPATCASVGATCGNPPDGCGGFLNCGSCSGYDTCGGGGRPYTCGCTPISCFAQHKECGFAQDGCGHGMDCGSCGCAPGYSGGVCVEGHCTACVPHGFHCPCGGTYPHCEICQ